MLISSIKQTSPGRLTVCFEDESEIKSSLAVVTDLRLFSGRELDDSQLEELRRLSSRSLARERALVYVSRRQFSRHELKTKLLQKGEDEDTADYCVQWLEENGFLNDENYSKSVARHYAAKGYGLGRIRGELQRRGLSRELWEGAYAAIPEDTSKLDKLVASKLKDPEDKVQVAKLSQSLYRRGFSWEEIRSAINRFNTNSEDY